jgi:hypothetical protein
LETTKEKKMEMEFEKETYDYFLTPQEEELIWLRDVLRFAERELTFWHVVSIVQAFVILVQVLLM